MSAERGEELVDLLDEDGRAIGTTAQAGAHHVDDPLRASGRPESLLPPAVRG